MPLHTCLQRQKVCHSFTNNNTINTDNRYRKPNIHSVDNFDTEDRVSKYCKTNYRETSTTNLKKASKREANNNGVNCRKVEHYEYNHR